jgi:hypothetical protein
MLSDNRKSGQAKLHDASGIMPNDRFDPNHHWPNRCGKRNVTRLRRTTTHRYEDWIRWDRYFPYA